MNNVRRFPVGKEGLPQLWERVAAGKATPQERIDAAALAGKVKDTSSIPQVWRLTADEDDLVRYYAVQALVLDLGVKDSQSAELCWLLLESDPDEDVQSMAATCLGSIFFGSDRLDVFQRLKALLGRDLPALVKGSVYSALFKVAGRPPSEWPGLTGPRKVFEDSDIDWGKVDELEKEIRQAGKLG